MRVIMSAVAEGESECEGRLWNQFERTCLLTDVACPGHCASLEGELADARSAGAEASAERDSLRNSLAEAEERAADLEHELVQLQCAIPKPVPIT